MSRALILFTAALLLIGTLACAAPDPAATPDIGATVEVMVQEAIPTPGPTPDAEATKTARADRLEEHVRATVAAWPTSTPLPTHTPAPTATPYPTSTPFPPLPTLAALPTLATLPTHTPQPTYTPVPTPTPLGFGSGWQRLDYTDGSHYLERASNSSLIGDEAFGTVLLELLCIKQGVPAWSLRLPYWISLTSSDATYRYSVDNGPRIRAFVREEDSAVWAATVEDDRDVTDAVLGADHRFEMFLPTSVTIVWDVRGVREAAKGWLPCVAATN